MSPATERRGLLTRLGRFIKESRSELKRVLWPNRRETVVFTSVVIVSVVIVSIAIWVIDSVFSFVLRMIIQ